MIVNLVIGGAIFGYAGYALYKFINKAKKGKCAGCAVEKTCSSNNCQ